MKKDRIQLYGGEDGSERGTRVEFFFVAKAGEGFLTVARGDDPENEERVAVLEPVRALILAKALMDFAIKARE